MTSAFYSQNLKFMTNCRACGGVLGRDCWNEVDCLQISANNYRNEDEQYVQELQEYNSILKYILDHNKIKIPDFNFIIQNPLVLKPMYSCENKYIDDGLPF